MRKYESVGIAVPDILLPNKELDYTKWAVVACDQFTSQPEYWEKADEIVADAPSTLRMIYPEVYLGEDQPEERINTIRSKMDEYLAKDHLVPREGMVYVEREASGKLRKGLVLCIDLEHYDYRKGSTGLIRATEGTILDRIPPRVKIREGAKLELPHIMVLIDDPDNTVIAPISDHKNRIEKLYDFKLMMDSGHLQGFLVNDERLEAGVINAIRALAEPQTFEKKYGLEPGTSVLLFAMGDGNHSLATAKAIWEKSKENAGDTTAAMDSAARYALVELVNLHDDALEFEPIHRVIFGIKEDRNLIEEMGAFYSGRFVYKPAASVEEVKNAVHCGCGGTHKIGAIAFDGSGVIEIANPDSNLAVGSLQNFLDKFMEGGGAREIDYVHGTEPVVELGGKPGNMGFYLPAMDKHELFKTVILDGALPRKTFSMGEAHEKRFYMECRRITGK